MKPLPIKTKEIELSGEYEGWKFTARTNPPLRILGDISSGNFDRIISGLADIILDWNFIDENGESLGDIAGLRAEGEKVGIQAAVACLTSDLATEVATAYSTAVTAMAPNSAGR